MLAESLRCCLRQRQGADGGAGRIADDLHARGDGVQKQDVWISLIDAAREDWSFGNGEMQ
jgi:hypothetical protein